MQGHRKGRVQCRLCAKGRGAEEGRLSLGQIWEGALPHMRRGEMIYRRWTYLGADRGGCIAAYAPRVLEERRRKPAYAPRNEGRFGCARTLKWSQEVQAR